MNVYGETNDRHQTVYLTRASDGTSALVKTSESAMRRYFYDALASYLSLYVRPEDEILEINPRSTGR